MWALIEVLIGIFLVNIPFGYWRQGTAKFSKSWFAAVHLPVPFVVLLRMIFGLALQLSTFPLFICAYFFGQFFGGQLRLRSREKDTDA